MKVTVCFVLAILSAAAASAGDLYMTPEGAGNRDGTAWEQALDGASLSRAINELLQPGDRLFVGGGTYRDVEVTISVGGSEGKPKTIVGADRGAGLPVFAATWSIDAPTRGRTAVRIGGGVSHVTFEHLRLSGYVMAVQATPAAEAARSHLTFDDVDIEQVRHAFYLSDCDDLRLRDCNVRRYSKHGFRFDQGCDRVTVQGCTADCSEGDAEWEKKTELLPFGFNVNNAGAPNTAVTFEDCLAANNLMPLQKNKYKNGDGYVVEGNAVGVKFIRCRAIRNQDGGFDLKPPDLQLTGCTALGNSKGFRIWTTGTLTNCLAAWGGVGMWNNGGPLTVDHCTFHELRSAAVMTDDKAKEPVTLVDCLISGTETTHKKTSHGKVVLQETTVVASGDDPQYVHPDAAWNGLGDAMNSRAFADKGYHAASTPKP